MTLAERIAIILDHLPVEFARGGGGAKSAKGKAGKASKKAKAEARRKSS